MRDVRRRWQANMPIVRIAAALAGDRDSAVRPGKAMPMTKPDPHAPAPSEPPRKELPEAAKRALAEAEARRAEAAKHAEVRAKEVQGPKGPEPTRYGDWEVKGIASDF
jgi:hypothetical protein